MGNLTIVPSDDIADLFSILTPSITTSVPPIPTAPVKRKGWPVRHCTRQGWYYRLIRVVHVLGNPENHNIMSPSAKPWSAYELAVLEEVKQKLADLYNNRFNEYHKMIAEEKGYEYVTSEKVNKFILK